MCMRPLSGLQKNNGQWFTVTARAMRSTHVDTTKNSAAKLGCSVSDSP